VTRSDYANVISRLGIDEAVSPRSVMAHQVTGLLNTGPIVFRNPYLVGGGVDVVELEVLNDAPVTRGTLSEVTLPTKSLLAAIMRDGFVHVPGAKSKLHAGDTVIAFVHSDTIDELAKAFTPS
jgi:trk system potassium uptake protein TrkA